MASTATAQPDPLQTLRAEEVAPLLQIKKATLYQLAREGKVPCIHVGRSVRFRRADLERWLAEGGES